MHTRSQILADINETEKANSHRASEVARYREKKEKNRMEGSTVSLPDIKDHVVTLDAKKLILVAT